MQRRKNLARRTQGVSEQGSGVPGGDGGATGHPTAAPDSLGASDTVVHDSGELDIAGSTERDDLTIRRAGDPTLGLTNCGRVGPDDWAANTGPTRTAEAGAKGVSRQLVKNARTPGGKKIDFNRKKK